MTTASPTLLPSANAPTGKPPISLPFLALIGAIAGGTPGLILPTATLIDVLGNAIMGAIVVAMMDLILLRKSLPPEMLQRGRFMLVLFVSVTLAIVTYRPAGLIFQTVFDTAPPLTVRNLTARAYTTTFPGPIAYRLQFDVDPTDIQTLQERMSPMLKRDGSSFSEYKGDPQNAGTAWPAYLKDKLDPASPLYKPALDFTTPQAYYWTSKTPNGHTAKTLLLYDAATKSALAEHHPG